MLWWRLRQLKSKDVLVRARTAEKLGNSNSLQAVIALISALEDPAEQVRLEEAFSVCLDREWWAYMDREGRSS